MSNPKEIQAHFFDPLYRQCEGGTIEQRFLPSKKQTQIPLESYFLSTLPINQNCFFGVGTRDGNGGKKENLRQIPALWMDYDFKRATEETLSKRTKDFPLQPSFIVETGGGVHEYWLLKEPATKEDIPIVEDLLKRLATYFGGDPAATDASRILRIPGSMNIKYNPPREVKLVKADLSLAYELEDFEQYLPPLETDYKEKNSTKHDPNEQIRIMMDNCSFLQHCDKDRATLPEPQWYSMVSQFSRMAGGRDWIHGMSRGHPKYDPKETDQKILQSINNATGPHTCAHINKLWPCGKNCEVTSPAALYRKRNRQKKTGSKEEKNTQSQILLEISKEAEYFKTPGDQVFSTFPQNGHSETWSVRSKGFRKWLLQKFYQLTGKPPGGQAIEDALGIIEAETGINGPELPVHIRVGRKDGSIFIDLCNREWEAIEITKNGWTITRSPEIRFYRTKGMLPLPYPVNGGTLEDLTNFVNIRETSSKRLYVGAVVGMVNPQGPYPILILQGDQGSTKTTGCRVIRSLVDPNISPLRTTPREERDLMIAANNSWLLVFDNISGLKPWLSDAFCRLSTGGGFSTRELYSNDQETIFDAMRPIILNGIDEIANRHDLIDRSIIINLPFLSENKRKPEKLFWREFEEARPMLLGSLCSALSEALKNEESIKLSSLPRMADFALWVSSAEPGLPWGKGEFMAAYSRNRRDAIELSLDNDQLAQGVLNLLDEFDEWTGRPMDLLEKLNEKTPEKTQRLDSWPKKPSSLSKCLRRAASFMRTIGVEIDFLKKDKKRLIRITQGKPVSSVSPVSSDYIQPEHFNYTEENSGQSGDGFPSSNSSPVSSPVSKIPSGNNGDGKGQSGDGSFCTPVSDNQLNLQDGDSGDGGDGNLHNNSKSDLSEVWI